MKNLDEVILEMTQELEKDTIEWIFRAIDKVKENYSKVLEETKSILDKKYGTQHSRDKVFALPAIKREAIDRLIGENIYNIGTYYSQRGVNRNSRTEKVLEDVSKDYNGKRLNLKNKILKLANNDKIISISQITKELNGKLGCIASLDNGDKIEIYTIYAGGWNIQKFHFRGLAKRKS